MQLVTTLECRFHQTPDGAVWADGAFSRHFWDSYLEVFDKIRVVARTRAMPVPAPDAFRLDGGRVLVSPVPHYIGPRQYLMNRRAVRGAVSDSIGNRDAVLLRVPSVLSFAAEETARRSGHPVALEVLGDPHDVFAPGAVRHILRPILRRCFTHRLQRQCRYACGAAYVTAQALQRQYPCDGFTAHFSDACLPEDAYATAPRTFIKTPNPLRILLIGSLEQMYKGADILIDAASECLQQGLEVTLSIVGDGKHREELQARAAARQIRDRVSFLGRLPHESIGCQLDAADLFILPSRAEGLPRAMLEAMVRGLPCIGSKVGGIPELLPPEALVPPSSAPALASKIIEFATNPQRMTEMATGNLTKSREYSESQMRHRRVKFYRRLRDETEKWLRR